MKLNGKNIIFDDDVTMTGNNIGEKLSEVIGELQSDSAKMKSYLKWIYNYGGVGGSGGGGGGGNNSDFILYAEFCEQQMKGQSISLGGAGNYPLRISIQRPGGAVFTVSYKIVSIEGNEILEKSAPIRLDIDNNYTCEKILTLDTNAKLIVEASDSIYNIKQSCDATFITQSYIIKTSFENEKEEKLGEEITVDDVISSGMYININYNVAVAYSSIDYILKIILKDKTIILSKENNSEYYKPISGEKYGKLSINLVDLIGNITEKEFGKKWVPSPENAGYYSYEITTIINLEGQNIKPKTEVVKFNLIPKDLYLLVTPVKGNIYVSDTSENPYKFNPGYIEFNVKPYKGPDINDPCEVSYYLNDKESDIKIIQTKIREVSSIRIYSIKEGINCINLNLHCGGRYYPGKNEYTTYYFYISENINGINWYFLEKERVGFFNYFRGGSDEGTSTKGDGEFNNRNLSNFRQRINHKAFKQSVNREAPSINLITKEGNTFIAKPEDVNNYDLIIPEKGDIGKYTFMLNLGFQYSDINNVDSPILTAFSSNDFGAAEKFFTLYQDKLVIDFTAEFKPISLYLPREKTDFGKDIKKSHLLSIVIRKVFEESMINYYELVIYIDGIIEASLPKYIKTAPNIAGIQFNKSNYFIDLVDLSYLIPLTKLDENGDLIGKPEDITVYQYFLKYKTFRIDKDEEDKLVKLNNYEIILKQVMEDHIVINNNGEVTCDETTVANIARNLSLPTMVMTLQDNSGAKKIYIDDSYNENGGNRVFDTSIMWAKPFSGLEKINFPNQLSNAMFRFYIQGSSTKSYKCKNFNLELVNRNEEGDVYLYSPNFDPTDKSTFLPEQIFTLKADVVDSGHSNNTSIGQFVNDITMPFKRGNNYNKNELLEGYIRNCLEGFPFVLYLQYVKTDEQGVDHKVCYYQGVYNFNMGRESHFNLGYSDYNVFCDSSGNSLLKPTENGFVFYSAPKDKVNLKEGLIVTEIQGNNNMFDFSQSDPSILFYNKIMGDELYMFGDLVLGSNSSEGQATELIQKMVDKVSKAGGYCFDYIKKSYSKTNDDKYGYADGYNASKKKIIGVDEHGSNIYKEISKNQVPNYRAHFKKQDIGQGRMEFVLDSYNPDYNAEEKDLMELILHQNAEDVDIVPWIDYRSLSEYYTICMAFGLVDSVQKNMNLKTWNADNFNKSATFYTAFYDMDTCLGLNNAGFPVSYFAFSDYWDYVSESTSGTVKPSPVTIYRDYSPKTSSGDIKTSDFYDTPSSYLFAVAKYAKAIYNSGDVSEVTNWPKFLWIKWRLKNSILEESDKTAGCLSSAEKFMDNYFNNTLGKVCPLMVSLNYRNKYLILDTNENNKQTNDIVFNTKNFEKFSGTRIHKVSDWLDSRFHILDAYFNVTNSISNYEYYDENGNYTNTTGLQEPFESLSESLRNNPDVLVYQDIFSKGRFNQGAGVLDIKVRAHEFSPLFISVANNSQRFLLGGKKLYNITTNLSGNQTYTFGGSNAWTELDSVNTFNFPVLNINSKYLETLVANNNNHTSLGEIIMPSLKTIDLSGPNISGELSLDGVNFSNLDSINLKSSSVNLNIRESECSSINISEMKDAVINIQECNNINYLEFGNGRSEAFPATVLKSCSIRPIPKKFSYNGLNLEYTKIKILYLSNKYNTGRSKFRLYHDSSIESLNLEGFREIEIEGCSNLSKIVISDPSIAGYGDTLKTLKIIECGNKSQSFNVGPTDTYGNVVDLRNFKDLDYIKITENYLITRVKLREDSKAIYLDKGAFKGNTKMKYLSGGNLYICGNSVFENCNAFTLKQGPEEDYIGSPKSWQLQLKLGNDLITGKPITDISNMFSISNGGGSLDLDTIKTFISTTKNLEIVTNISYLFYSQHITYNEAMLKDDLLKGNTITLNMERFKKVTKADGFIGEIYGITALNKYMLNFGSEILENESISATNFVSNTVSTEISYSKNGSYFARSRDRYYYATLDLFSFIIEKLSSNIGRTGIGTTYYLKLKIVELDGGVLKPVGLTSSNPLRLSKLFHPVVNGRTLHPKYMESLGKLGFIDDFYNFKEHPENNIVDNGYYKVSPDCSLYIDLTGVFNNWPTLKSIYGFLYDKNYNNVITSSLDGLFKNQKGFKYLRDSLRINNSSNPINLIDFIDWEAFGKTYNNDDPFSNSKNNNEVGSFILYKYVTSSDMTMIWKYLKDAKCTGASNIFRNCTMVTKENPIVTAGGQKNTTIKYLNNTYKNFKTKKYDGDLGLTPDHVKEISLNSSIPYSYFSIDPNIFKALSGVISLEKTFENTSITSPMEFDYLSAIPMNFFNKRKVTPKSVYYLDPTELTGQEEIVEGVYITKKDGVLVDEELEKKFKPAELYVHSFNKTIINMRDMFRNVKWFSDVKRNARCYIPPIKETPEGDFVADWDRFETDYIRIIETGKIIKVEGTDVYQPGKGLQTITTETGESIDVIYEGFKRSESIKINSEVKDLMDIINAEKAGGYISEVQTKDLEDNTVIFKNFSLNENFIRKSFFIAPDFFYGCANNCNIEGVFRNDEPELNVNNECLEGMIPPHLLKEVKHVSFRNMMKNLNIVPRYILKEYKYSNSEINNVYSYIPSDFTEYTNLSDSFNFHFMIPDKGKSLTGGKKEYDTYYYLLDDSISKYVSSLSNAFPSKYYVRSSSGSEIDDALIIETPGNTDGGYPNTHLTDFDIHINLMYNRTKTEIKEEGLVGIGVDGLAVSKFKQLNLDGLVPPVLSYFYYGNLVDNAGFTLNDIRWGNPNSFVIRTIYLKNTEGEYHWSSAISRNMILPGASNITDDFQNNYIIGFGSSNLSIYKSQINGISQPYTTIVGNPAGSGDGRINIRLVD